MKKYFLLLILISSLGILGQNKSNFDIQENHLKDGLKKTQGGYETQMILSE